MLTKGVIDELSDIHNYYIEEGIRRCLKPNFGNEIFQQIGFKQFHKYLQLSTIERLSSKGHHLKNIAIYILKFFYKRTARSDEKWIKKTFLEKSEIEVPQVYRFDLNENSESDILKISTLIENLILNKTPSQEAESILENDPCKIKLSPGQYFCNDCGRILNNILEWNAHINSKNHAKKVKYNSNM